MVTIVKRAILVSGLQNNFSSVTFKNNAFHFKKEWSKYFYWISKIFFNSFSVLIVFPTTLLPPKKRERKQSEK